MHEYKLTRSGIPELIIPNLKLPSAMELVMEQRNGPTKTFAFYFRCLEKEYVGFTELDSQDIVNILPAFEQIKEQREPFDTQYDVFGRLKAPFILQDIQIDPSRVTRLENVTQEAILDGKMTYEYTIFSRPPTAMPSPETIPRPDINSFSPPKENYAFMRRVHVRDTVLDANVPISKFTPKVYGKSSLFADYKSSVSNTKDLSNSLRSA